MPSLLFFIAFCWVLTLLLPLFAHNKNQLKKLNVIPSLYSSIRTLRNSNTPFSSDTRSLAELEMAQMLRWEYQFALQTGRTMKMYWGLEENAGRVSEFAFRIQEHQLLSFAEGTLPANVTKTYLDDEDSWIKGRLYEQKEEEKALPPTTSKSASDLSERIRQFNEKMPHGRIV